MEDWKAKDPITRLGALLADEGILSADEQARMRDEVQQTIDGAAARAASAPWPALEEMGRYVYAE